MPLNYFLKGGFFVVSISSTGIAGHYLLLKSSNPKEPEPELKVDDLLTEQAYKKILGPILKEGPAINLGKIKDMEEEIGCEFWFVWSKADREKYRADDDKWSYEYQEEMLKSLNKQYTTSKENLKTSCKKWADKKLKFSRDSNGQWWAMSPAPR